MRGVRSLPLVVSSLLTLSCGPEFEWDGGRTYESQHFRYHTRLAETGVCPQILDNLELHLRTVVDALDVHWPSGANIDYYKFLDQDDYEAAAGCPTGTRGCYSNYDIRTPDSFHAHELVHAYADVLWGSTHRLLSEGLAVALSCQPWYPNEAYLDWAELYRDFRGYRRRAYGLSGAFVTHLIVNRGAKRFADLYSRVARDDSAGAFASTFQAVYGEHPDAVWRRTFEVAGYPSCLPAWPCAAAALQAEDSVGPSCDSSGERVLSRQSGFGRHLVVQGKGFRAISCSHFVRPLLLRGGSWDYDFTAQHFLEQDVAAYALTRFGSGLGSSDSEVAAVSSGLLERPWIGSDCPSLDAVQIEPGILTTLSVQSSNDFRYVRLRADKGGIVRISRAVSGLVVCNSCDTAPSQCLPVLARNEEFAIDGEAVLALQGTPGPGLSTLELQLVGAMMPESGSQGADPLEDDAPGDQQ